MTFLTEIEKHKANDWAQLHGELVPFPELAHAHQPNSSGHCENCGLCCAAAEKVPA